MLLSMMLIGFALTLIGCKGKENVDALRTRYTRELKWFTDMVDIFNS